MDFPHGHTPATPCFGTIDKHAAMSPGDPSCIRRRHRRRDSPSRLYRRTNLANDYFTQCSGRRAAVKSRNFRPSNVTCLQQHRRSRDLLHGPKDQSSGRWPPVSKSGKGASLVRSLVLRSRHVPSPSNLVAPLGPLPADGRVLRISWFCQKMDEHGPFVVVPSTMKSTPLYARKDLVASFWMCTRRTSFEQPERGRHRCSTPFVYCRERTELFFPLISQGSKKWVGGGIITFDVQVLLLFSLSIDLLTTQRRAITCVSRDPLGYFLGCLVDDFSEAARSLSLPWCSAGRCSHRSGLGNQRK